MTPSQNPTQSCQQVRKLRATVTDSIGNEVMVAWPVRKDQHDGHADAFSAVTRIYHDFVGDSPEAAEVHVRTEFVEGAESS